jgi:hypothetical protein
MMRLSLVVAGLLAIVPVSLLADDAACREIVNKAIERIGGEKTLAKYKASTSKIKGTIQINGSPLAFTGDLSSQGMDQQRIFVSLILDGQNISVTNVLNKDQGWSKINDTNIDMTAEQLADTKNAAYAAWVETLVPLKDKAFTLSPFGESEAAGRKLTGINVAREGHRLITLFFDKETSQLVRCDKVVHDEQSSKDVSEESTYSNFKTVDGIQFPHKISIKRDGMAYAEVEVEEFKPAEKLDDSVFAKP